MGCLAVSLYEDTKLLIACFQIIVTEASKVIQNIGRSWRPTAQISESESITHMGSSAEHPTVLRSPSQSWKVTIRMI